MGEQGRLSGVLPGAVVQTGMVVQHLVSRRWPRAPRAPNVSQSFNWTSWSSGWPPAAVGGLLSGITPFKPGQAMAMA
jgi:phosphatidate cytidylyltransferase